jgi:hypothetical protein
VSRGLGACHELIGQLTTQHVYRARQRSEEKKRPDLEGTGHSSREGVAGCGDYKAGGSADIPDKKSLPMHL